MTIRAPKSPCTLPARIPILFTGFRLGLNLESKTNEPFCTVLPAQVCQSVVVSKGQFSRQTRRPDLPSRTRADPDADTVFPAARTVFIKLQSAPVAFG